MERTIWVRAAEPVHAETWARLRTALWPEAPSDHPVEIAAYFAGPPDDAACFVAEVDGDGVLAFAEVGLRRYAEGCTTSPVGFLEGIYVEPGARRMGVARALATACEAWSRSMGCTEFASDRAVDNEASGAFHRAIGFEEVHTIVCYRKAIDAAVGEKLS